MSDDDYGYDVYGDTDPNNVPDGGFDQDTSAGDGLPGYPVDGQPGWRAGAFGSGRGLLGLIKVSNPSGGDAAMPRAYMPDGHGGVRLRPGFAASHPKGPFDWSGMSKEINWPGVALDLGKIGMGVGASVAAGVGGPLWDACSALERRLQWKQPPAQPAAGPRPIRGSRAVCLVGGDGGPCTTRTRPIRRTPTRWSSRVSIPLRTASEPSGQKKMTVSVWSGLPSSRR
jgi:hypothetical protein